MGPAPSFQPVTEQPTSYDVGGTRAGNGNGNGYDPSAHDGQRLRRGAPGTAARTVPPTVTSPAKPGPGYGGGGYGDSGYGQGGYGYGNDSGYGGRTGFADANGATAFCSAIRSVFTYYSFSSRIVEQRRWRRWHRRNRCGRDPESFP